VSCCDLKGIEHSIEVTADSLYEAVAHGLRVFRENDWVDDVGRGQTTVTVVVRQPEVEHKVRVRDFEQWLESQGRTPAEMSLKSRLRELMRTASGDV
jgi:predicted urease superfamily metal-dependent hydrolase